MNNERYVILATYDAKGKNPKVQVIRRSGWEAKVPVYEVALTVEPGQDPFGRAAKAARILEGAERNPLAAAKSLEER
jgi:hypothetical protein